MQKGPHLNVLQMRIFAQWSHFLICMIGSQGPFHVRKEDTVTPSPVQPKPLALLQTTFTALLSGIFFLAGCTSFSHLTRIDPEGQNGPQASQCSACHVQQYQEWKGTAHARAFTSRSFQENAGSPAEEECLRCHAPLGVPAGKAEARSFHRQEGVSCISCHLSQGKMHGPHKRARKRPCF